MNDTTSNPTVHEPEKNVSRKRPMTVLVLASISVPIMLILVAIFFALGTSANVCCESPSPICIPSSREQLFRQQAEDRSHGEISDDDDDCEYEDEEEIYYEDEYSYRYEWSQEQIEEMDRYHERYLEVFLEKHGDQYEPEDKEVVYTEYLAFKERKAKARAEKKQADQAKVIETEKEHEGDHKDKTISVESHTVHSSSIPNHVVIKHDPYYLEIDWADFNEVGGDLYSSSNNYTETMTTVTSAPATSTVVRKIFAADAISTIHQQLSGRGKPIQL